MAAEIIWPTKPKVFLPGLLQKKFAEPWFRDIKPAAFFEGDTTLYQNINSQPVSPPYSGISEFKVSFLGQDAETKRDGDNGGLAPPQTVWVTLDKSFPPQGHRLLRVERVCVALCLSLVRAT